MATAAWMPALLNNSADASKMKEALISIKGGGVNVTHVRDSGAPSSVRTLPSASSSARSQVHAPRSDQHKVGHHGKSIRRAIQPILVPWSYFQKLWTAAT